MKKILHKRIAPLLIASVALANVSLFSLPENAHAQFVVSDPILESAAIPFFATTVAFQTKQALVPSVWNIVEQDGILPALQAIAEDFATQIIQNLTEKTVNWIKNGFNGNSAFIPDIGDFLTKTADQTIGEELFNDPALNFLCAPFQAQVKIALGLSYYQPFYKQINCTLTGAIANATNAVNNFANSFSASGGWKNWIEITTQPQNNPVGAFLIAKANIDSQISAKQAAAGMELTNGQGALTYKDCTKTTYDQNGNETSVTHLPKGSDIAYTTVPTTSTHDRGYDRVDCTVSTPGAVITNMLGFSATDDLRVTELKSALSNGIDQVLASLASALIQKAVSALQNGILGNNNAANANYSAQINSVLQQQQSQYNQAASQIQNPNYTPTYNLGGQLTPYDSFLGTDYSSGFNPTPATTTGAQGISISDPFYSQKTNSLSIINGILNFESQYQSVFAPALNILQAGRAVFANAASCNISLGNNGDPVSYNRGIGINANVISNIDQTVNYSRTVPQIPWSLAYVENSINVSNAHIAILTAAEGTITGATTADAITSQMNTINGTNFGLDQPLANLVSNIRGWLTQMQTAYNTAACPIDLTAALTGAAPAQTGASSTVTTGTPTTGQ